MLPRPAICGIVAAASLINVAMAADFKPVTRTQTEYRLTQLPSGFQLADAVFSMDGRRVVYITTVDGKAYSPEPDDDRKVMLVVNDKRSGPYQGVGSFVFSPDSKRFAHTAIRDNKGYLVVDGHKSEYHGENIRELQFSPDSRRVAYIADTYNANGPDYVVVDGKPEPAYGSVNALTFSPDGKRLAYIATNAHQESVVVLDGHESKRYKSMLLERNLRFSPDGKRVAYSARDDQGAFVVVDGKESPRYLGFSDDMGMGVVHFSPDSRRYLYVPQFGQHTYAVVVDGAKGKQYRGKIGIPAFSPDSKRVSYVVTTFNEYFVVTNSAEGRHYKGRYDFPGISVFGPESQRLAYSVQTDNGWIVVVNDKEIARYKSVGRIKLSPDGTSIAFQAYDGKNSFVVLNGVEGPRYDSIMDIVFSPDGKTLAYIARSETTKKWFVVVNGEKGKSYDQILGRDLGPNLIGLTFDSNNSLYYLVRENNVNLIRVEEKLDIGRPES